MKVFLSWSGDRSKALALKLKVLLPNCIQQLAPFLSSTDIEPGANWFNEIDGALDDAQGLGIFIITPENLESRWLHFEAGYVAATAEGKSRVCCLLLGVRPDQLKYPLQAFNHVSADAEGVTRLLGMLNNRLPQPLTQDQLDFALSSFRPLFEAAVQEALHVSAGQQANAYVDTPALLEQLATGINRIENALAAQVRAQRPQVTRGLAEGMELEEQFDVVTLRLTSDVMAAIDSNPTLRQNVVRMRRSVRPVPPIQPEKLAGDDLPSEIHAWATDPAHGGTSIGITGRLSRAHQLHVLCNQIEAQGPEISPEAVRDAKAQLAALLVRSDFAPQLLDRARTLADFLQSKASAA